MSKKEKKKFKEQDVRSPQSASGALWAIPEEVWEELAPIVHEVAGIVLLALAIFAGFCNFFPQHTGLVGRVVMAIIGRAWFGQGA